MTSNRQRMGKGENRHAQVSVLSRHTFEYKYTRLSSGKFTPGNFLAQNQMFLKQIKRAKILLHENMT